MDIVADTSVIIAVIANEPEREALVELTTGAELIAPHSVQKYKSPLLSLDRKLINAAKEMKARVIEVVK